MAKLNEKIHVTRRGIVKRNPQKRMRRFYYKFDKETVSRTYGGSNYTLGIFEMKRGGLERLGEVSGCTRGHKGYESEVLGWLIQNGHLPKVYPGKDAHHAEAWTNSGGYYSWTMKEDAGFSIEGL